MLLYSISVHDVIQEWFHVTGLFKLVFMFVQNEDKCDTV